MSALKVLNRTVLPLFSTWSLPLHSGVSSRILLEDAWSVRKANRDANRFMIYYFNSFFLINIINAEFGNNHFSYIRQTKTTKMCRAAGQIGCQATGNSPSVLSMARPPLWTAIPKEWGQLYKGAQLTRQAINREREVVKERRRVAQSSAEWIQVSVKPKTLRVDWEAMTGMKSVYWQLTSNSRDLIQ